MTRKGKLVRWLFVIVFCLGAGSGVGPVKAQSQPIFREPGSSYTSLGCLAKPDELFFVAPPYFPRLFYNAISQIDERATRVRIAGQYDLPFSTYGGFPRFEGRQEVDARVAYLIRGPDIHLWNENTFLAQDPEDPEFGALVAEEIFPLQSNDNVPPAFTISQSAFESLLRDIGVPQEAVGVAGDDIALLREILQASENLADNIADIKRKISATPNFYLSMIEGAGGHSPGLNPFGSGPAEAVVSSYADFQTQWAITETKALTMYKTYEDSGGEGVVVGLFDTGPFQYITRTIPFTATEVVSISTGVSATPVLTMTNHFTAVSGPSADHGVFVAGLLQEIAPEADIHLYQTFNDTGITDNFTLSYQLAKFHEEYLEPYKNPQLNPSSTPITNPHRIVANMSFSISCTTPFNANDEVFQEQIANIKGYIDSLIVDGAFIVASAGNTPISPTVTSGVTSTVPFTRPQALFPAIHPDVIGVGALDSDGKVSCYSHEGDIYAPGGGRVPGSTGRGSNPNGESSCQPDYYSCAYEAGCEHAILGFVTKSPSGLGYWYGTSFAAPIVSGLVALMLGDPPPPSEGSEVEPDPSQIPLEDIKETLHADTYEINRAVTTPVP